MHGHLNVKFQDLPQIGSLFVYVWPTLNLTSNFYKTVFSTTFLLTP